MKSRKEKENEENKNAISYLVSKRLLDIVISILALILLSPIFLVVLIIDSFGQNRGSLLFKQERLGKNGQIFKIFKFRSMVMNADQKLKQNKSLYAKYVANSYKLPEGEDPRVTRFGQILRKSSLDEIPQFLNILKGEMSVVGPRPIVKEELKEYGERGSEFLSVKPGALGYWQATGRSNVGYPERCDVELYYVRHASLRFDIKIFFKNIFSIVSGSGAF